MLLFYDRHVTGELRDPGLKSVGISTRNKVRGVNRNIIAARIQMLCKNSNRSPEFVEDRQRDISSDGKDSVNRGLATSGIRIVRHRVAILRCVSSYRGVRTD